MSSCTFANRKLSINSEKIFLALPGIIVGLAIDEFIGKKISTSYGYLATGVLLFTAIATILWINFIPTPRKNSLKWFIFILLIGNILSSAVYLVIITLSEEPMDQETPNAMSVVRNEENLESQKADNLTTSTTPAANSGTTLSPEEVAELKYTHGIKASIAFIVLSVLLFLNSLAAHFVRIDRPTTDEGDNAAGEPGVGDNPELKPLDNGNGNNDDAEKEKIDSTKTVDA